MLRIEDTDTERNRDESIDGIQSALAGSASNGMKGLTSRASARRWTPMPRHKLYQTASAYYCDCTREVIDAGPRAMSVRLRRALP